MYYYDQWGQKRRWSDVEAVKAIEELKKKSGSNPWPVIEKCIEVWEKSNPNDWKSFLYEVEEVRRTRRDKFAASDSKKDPTHNGILRYTLDITEKVMYMIRAIYSAQELPMNREFLREFAKRFPRMRVAKQI